MGRTRDVSLWPGASAGVAADEEATRKIRADGNLILGARREIKTQVVLLRSINGRGSDDHLLHVRYSVESATEDVRQILSGAQAERTEIETARDLRAATIRSLDNVRASRY